MPEPIYRYHTRSATNVTVVNPPGSHEYLICLPNQTGVAAANVFLSLLNPLGSGKVIHGDGFTVSNFATATNTVSTAMILRRITGHSSGVDSSADIIPLDPTSPASVLSARTANPTTTSPSAPVVAISPPILIGATANVTTLYQFQSPYRRFVVPPGYGIQIGTASGSTTQQWNISVTWIESPE